MDVKWSSRIAELPPYLFAEIDAKKNELKFDLISIKG